MDGAFDRRAGFDWRDAASRNGATIGLAAAFDFTGLYTLLSIQASSLRASASMEALAASSAEPARADRTTARTTFQSRPASPGAVHEP